MQKTVQKTTFLLFIVLHFSFLGGVLIDNEGNPWIWLILLIIASLLLFFYLKEENQFERILRKRDSLSIAMAVSGAYFTYFLNHTYDLGVVLSAGITGLAGSFIPLFNSKSELLKVVPTAMYCGAFAGMTAPHIASDYSFILYAGFLTGILLVFARDFLNGHGGKLGTIAFGGVSIVYFVIYLAEL